MQGVRAPTDPSHWHAATRVLPARVQRICRPTRNVHRARKPSCASSAATTVVSMRRDHFITTLSPPVRSIQHVPKLAGRLLAAQMAMDPSNSNCGTAPRLLERKRVLRARGRHVPAQPRCCTSRVNRESARTGNIARPFVVSVDDVSPNSASEATGRLWAQRVLRSPRDWTRQSETEQDKGQCRPGEASGREYGPYRVCRQPKALLRRADFTDHVSLLSAEVWALSLFAPCLRRAPREKLEPGGWACAPRRLQAGSLAGLAGPAATGRI